MPHIHIDYSPNLDKRLDVAGLCRVLRDVAVTSGVVPLAGVRVRAVAATHVVIADGNPEHAYLDVSVRLRGGRDLQTRKRLVTALFEASTQYCSELMATSSLAISMEMRDIDPELSPKTGSIRDHLPKDPA